MSNEAVANGETVLLRQACDKFVAAFGRKPVAAAAAPGRVNLIGEHVDYCEGFVLPVVSYFQQIHIKHLGFLIIDLHYVPNIYKNSKHYTSNSCI